MSSMQRRSERGARGGFSLLELVGTLALITVLATVSIWAFFSRGEVTLENAARLLVEDLHLAQSRAMFLRTPVAVEFDADGLGYVVRDEGQGLPSGLEALDRGGRRYDVDAVFQGVRIHEVRGASGRAVHFDARGVTAIDVWVTLAYRGETRTVQIDHAAGIALLVDGAQP
jgi:Tfp pilus assembly protein FimT